MYKKDRVIKLFEQRKTKAQIAREVGMAYQNVDRIIETYKLQKEVRELRELVKKSN
jgi:hypothetical protein